MEILNKNGKLTLPDMKLGKSKARNEYDMIILDFMKEINKERENTSRPKVTYMSISSKLPKRTPNNPKGISNEDLHWFYKRCQEYARQKGGSFSRGFFGSLKEKANVK